MKKLGAALLVLAGCGTDPSLPQYMQDLPRSEEDALKIVAEIRRELGETFAVEWVSDFFVVACNDTPASFRACKGTISRVYAFLTTEFFTRKPEKPIRVYVFKNKESYENYCKATYQKAPSTPFGFYMARERKMVMNIETGRGTLAHELVHPLLTEDFPDVPSWFNEGFASLFEQSGERNGKMVGFVNWRLPKLQEALKASKGVPLRELLKTTTDQFYGDARGVNYATARYLCLWLQENELLLRFYKAFKAGFEKDRTGLETLEKLTGKSLEEFEKGWRDWVLKLRFGN